MDLLNDLAGSSKKAVAPDIVDFIEKNPKVVSLLRAAKNSELSDEEIYDLEKKIGFNERKNETNFFRKGETDEWKNSLPSNLIKKIETHFKKEMEELSYI